MSHSANQSAAPAVATSSPSEAHPTGRPAGILPMPAQLLAASHGGGGGGGGGPPPAASASASPKGTQQDSNGGVPVPSTGGGDNAAQGPAQNVSSIISTSLCSKERHQHVSCLQKELCSHSLLLSF